MHAWIGFFSRLPHGLVMTAALFFTVGNVRSDNPKSPLPVETFFAEPDISSPRLSPDGHYVAFLTTLGWGKVGIALQDLVTPGKQPEAFASAQDENIKTFFWKGNDFIVYGGDPGGNESYAWRSVAVASPKSGRKREAVILNDSYDGGRLGHKVDIMQIVDALRYDPHHIMVEGNKERDSRTFGVFFEDVRTGARNLIPDYDPSFEKTTFLADNNGALRARRGVAGKKMIYEVCPAPGATYVKVAEFPAENPKWDFLFFAADNETLYLLNWEHSDTATLHSLNVRTRELSPPLFNSPDGEISGVRDGPAGGILISWDRSKLYGVRYETDKPHYKFFDPAREKLQQMIDGALPGTLNEIVSSSQDEKIHVVLAHSDRDPGTFYILDTRHGRLGPIGRVRPKVNPAQMQPMEPISYQARDGLVLHGYLTRPANSTGHRVPLIIHPHGGPYGIRDSWGYDPEVQFLASRGYAVLQVNYRGSGGYGTSFERAGYHEWGGKMQDDLTDGVKWAIAQGIADPGKVAIFGASYGGYATLAGLTFTPELYCCGINYVGPSDLQRLVSQVLWATGDEGKLSYETQIGTNYELLRSRSPVNFVDHIRVPLLNAYGFNDPRVDIEQWKLLEPKLKQFNKSYEIIREDEEGHGFRNESNRVAFYKKVETFLAHNLSP
jgi:dipeptidyl aminopeptidase/acylaminoacyl peptidase